LEVLPVEEVLVVAEEVPLYDLCLLSGLCRVVLGTVNVC